MLTKISNSLTTSSLSQAIANRLGMSYMHKGVGGGFDPPPQAGEKMYRVGGENRKKKEKGKNQEKIGKIRLKIGKRGKTEENHQIWLKIGTNGSK